MATKLSNKNWDLSKKIAFRFFFLLLVQFICFNNNGAFPFFDKIMYWPTVLLHKFIPWMADNVFHYQYDHTIFTNGSGDTSYDFVLLGTITLVSLLGTLIWSAFDNRRKSYNTLYYWLLVLVRCYVAFTLISYGMYKVVKLQFPDPYLTRLIQPFGEASPMGLAWTFLGFSKGYNLFMGIVEVLAVLLLFRRTMIVGAFLALAASAHVMSMNYFYDVPVKILSTALVVMCFFVLAPYLKRILQFFLTRQPASLNIIEAPSYKKKWQYYSIYTFKYLIILFSVVQLGENVYSSYYQYGDGAPNPPLYGIYRTESFKLNNTELPPLTTDSVRWRDVIVQWNGGARIKLMNDSVENVGFRVDTLNRKVSLFYYADTVNKSTLKYAFPEKDLLNLYGIINKDSVNILLRQRDLKKMRLTTRGFRWVNEYPYNR